MIRECARRLLAGESLRSICGDLNERGDSDGAGRRVEAADAAADAAVGPDQRPARAPRRDRRATRSGRRSSPRPRRRGSGRCSPIRTRRTNRERPPLPARPAAALRPVRADARLAADAPTERAATSARTARASAAAAGSSVMADRWNSSSSRPSCYRLDSPELAAALSRRAAATRTRERWQARDRAGAGPAGRAGQDCTASRGSALSEWLAARTPIEQRLTDAQKQLGAADPHHGAGRLRRQRRPATGALGRLPLTRQHAIVAAVLDHVVVAPAGAATTASTPPVHAGLARLSCRASRRGRSKQPPPRQHVARRRP